MKKVVTILNITLFTCLLFSSYTHSFNFGSVKDIYSKAKSGITNAAKSAASTAQSVIKNPTKLASLPGDIQDAYSQVQNLINKAKTAKTTIVANQTEFETLKKNILAAQQKKDVENQKKYEDQLVTLTQDMLKTLQDAISPLIQFMRNNVAKIVRAVNTDAGDKIKAIVNQASSIVTNTMGATSGVIQNLDPKQQDYVPINLSLKLTPQEAQRVVEQATKNIQESISRMFGGGTAKK